MQCTVTICTCWWKSKLSAGHISICSPPQVIAHSAPLIVVADFHSTLKSICSSNKPDTSSCANCEKILTSYTTRVSLCLFPRTSCYYKTKGFPHASELSITRNMITVGSRLSECPGTKGCLDNWNVRMSERILFVYKVVYFPFNAQQNKYYLGFSDKYVTSYCNTSTVLRPLKKIIIRIVNSMKSITTKQPLSQTRNTVLNVLWQILCWCIQFQKVWAHWKSFQHVMYAEYSAT